MKHPVNWFNSLNYACNGLRLLCSERNFRIHLLAAVSVCILSLCLHLSTLEWAFIASAIVLVLVTESINTCIEYLCDFITADYSFAIKKIKDIAAAAVLLSTVYALTLAFIILLPKILYLTTYNYEF
ncbi:diacylglycerol kinase family protein [Cytophaga hutchinsonii]|jgi:diacylglycerol kinase|uniref:Diacylglycerol kinase n=1 Tax=Cytophaga hutchinsonii (strain ATCC 33406 / DSM 1761 / CIP 103989 / NBRC 15051 / NCIMB 9469 / D465) TaxID=269798 RepID=A0A6N4STQ4_CYTH3|nr:diacylglycerol kinase family protein [Cytophaga hutchinsonii]ABG59834.1 diacylglycerol kinase [Cytophaga hutchinsonii ATCC 33406]SFX29069.1 diacylglycerol kinase (ATP) [Cytophaga hutchinsonii ATCC 33406]